MTDAANIWDEVPDWGGIGARRLVRAGSGLGASIWKIHPGGDYWRHFHHASDELLIVLRGTPTVSTPEGTRRLNEGDVLPLPRGSKGDRTIANLDSRSGVDLLLRPVEHWDALSFAVDRFLNGAACSRLPGLLRTRTALRHSPQKICFRGLLAQGFDGQLSGHAKRTQQARQPVAAATR